MSNLRSSIRHRLALLNLVQVLPLFANHDHIDHMVTSIKRKRLFCRFEILLDVQVEH